ncbi:hypothetical protein [Mycobacterium sp. DL440]|uniref:hypothetical protein n=1 Tax=Mycobacterium sp. DL440 TaxID=2675523 RepID=UPI001424A19F|nr:hypothetical protein [Mycobacterium sp. DL440]
MSGFDTLDAIEHAGVTGFLSECDKILATKQLAERQTQALNKIRELHRANGAGGCVCCHWNFPCATIRAIDEAGA